MSTAEELAHWRYRSGAIHREITHLEGILKRKRESDARARDYQRFLVLDKGGSRDEGREAFRRPTDYTPEIAELKTQLEANTYLLEEARYMILLKEIELDIASPDPDL
jgi:hypothetical protein